MPPEASLSILGLRLSLFGTYRERYQNAYNFDPAAWSAANAPQVDDFNGNLTGQLGALIPGSGDPFNGMVQCGVNGVPAGCMTGHLVQSRSPHRLRL